MMSIGKPPGCGVCHLLPVSDWNVLCDEELIVLDAGHRPFDYGAGETVYAMGESNRGVYCVSTGTVGIRKLDAEGNSVLLQMAYPGDVLGYRSFLADREHRTTAEALGPSRVCLIDSSTVSQLLGDNPDLGIQFLKRATGELEQAHDAIIKGATLSNRARLAHLLLVMTKKHGRVADDGSRSIDLPVSRRDLASMVGTRHETLSRIMGRLEEDGIARFSGRNVVVPCLDTLAAEISGSA